MSWVAEEKVDWSVSGLLLWVWGCKRMLSHQTLTIHVKFHLTSSTPYAHIYGITISEGCLKMEGETVAWFEIRGDGEDSYGEQNSQPWSLQVSRLSNLCMQKFMGALRYVETSSSILEEIQSYGKSIVVLIMS